MSADAYTEQERLSPRVEYDDDGNFVGVAFPTPPPVESDALDHPWAKG
jgi:hypothetical protein